jgi:hypothetical protein
MDRIQFRVHPSVGMARIGKSKHWYFLGPEIPRFIQEQFPKLRQQPVALPHPKGVSDPPEVVAASKPEPNSFRDKTKLNPADKFGSMMPQAARFRVFAYFYTPGITEPYKVLELKPEHADIEWTVTLANQKGVIKVNDTLLVNANTPDPVTLSTKAATPAQKCEMTDKPNLAWLTLEEGPGGAPTNRLHLIGNEGEADGLLPFTRSAAGTAFLLQNDWQDTAADGPVAATVELKPAFTTAFAGYQFLFPGTAEAQDLPVDRKVTALPAWAVVNLPDYTPDMGHFVSLWDLALNQSWNQVIENKKIPPVIGRHGLVTAASEANSYAFYDYFTHIHPQLGLFTDVTYTSGQARAGSHSSGESNRYTNGIAIETKLDADEQDDQIVLPRFDALMLKAAAQGAAFQATITGDPNDPLAHQHEFVLCTSIEDDGTVNVLRGQNGTNVVAWTEGFFVVASSQGGVSTEARLGDDVASGDGTIKIDVHSARRMPMPTAAGANERDKAFTLAITASDEVEWMSCSKIEYIPKAGTMVAQLTVTRAQNGTRARDWDLLTAKVVAPASGHKTLNARARTQALYRSASGPLHKMIFGRLRKSFTLYDRKTFKKNKTTTKETTFPREFGRRENIGTVSTDTPYNGTQNVDPGGSVSRYHDRFINRRTQKEDSVARACHGQLVSADVPPLPRTMLLPGEDYHLGPQAVTLEEHARQLDDYYWIVSEADMPLLKELAFTHLQYNQFEYWANNQVTGGVKPTWAPLFEVIFKAGNLTSFFAENHTREEYINMLFACRPRYAPAFLDIASMGRMLGGSFLPGIEVGREAGIPGNWSLFHGGTVYFPDVRFAPMPKVAADSSTAIPIGEPLPEPAAHSAGQLTKDLAVPWFADFIACGETFWPTSRPSVVQQKNGPAYDWLSGAVDEDDATLIAYWTKLGFIRRQPDDAFHETEALFERP